jgi:hypothetical protein
MGQLESLREPNIAQLDQNKNKNKRKTKKKKKKEKSRRKKENLCHSYLF